MRALILPAVVAAACLATACALPFDIPAAAEAPLALDAERIVVQRLHCAAGHVLAAGYRDSFTDLEGVALHSGDAGATWQPARIEPRATGVALATVPWPAGPDRGAVFLSGYRIGPNLWSDLFSSHSRYEAGPWWSTGDGGRSWQATSVRVPLPPTDDIGLTVPELVVADAAGTLVTAANSGGGPLALLRSTDGGANWSRQAIASLTHFGSVVTDGRGGLALSGRSRGQAGVVLWSDDGGATWTEGVISTGGRFPFRAPEALKLYRSPAGALVAFNSDPLGKGRSPAWLFASLDGGRSWSFVQGFDRVGPIVGIGAGRDGGLVAVTEWGSVLLGDPRGTARTLAPGSVPVRDGHEISHVVFAPTGVIVAAHYRGTLHRSTDDGRSWQRVDSGLPDRQHVLDTHCTGPDGLIVVAGSGGMLTRSLDGGATWQPGRVVTTTADRP